MSDNKYTNNTKANFCKNFPSLCSNGKSSSFYKYANKLSRMIPGNMYDNPFFSPVVEGVAQELGYDSVPGFNKGMLAAGTATGPIRASIGANSPGLFNQKASASIGVEPQAPGLTPEEIAALDAINAQIAASKQRPNAAPSSTSAAAPVAQSRFVHIPATRYATVDPLNIFGNRNGVNPFAQDNNPYNMPGRFSGGIATPEQTLPMNHPRLDGSTLSMF